MEYTVGEVIDKLMELSGGDMNMIVKGIRQVNCPHEIGTLMQYHNIGINKLDKEDWYGNPIKVLEIVSGGNNIKK